MGEQGKAAAKRQLILDAAFNEIAENSIAGTNLRKIAKRAGMSQGNLHYYYPAKDTLLLDLLDHLLANFIAERKKIADDMNKSPVEKLQLLINREQIHVQRKREMSVFMYFCVHGANDQYIQQRVQKTYAAWLMLVRSVIRDGVSDNSFSGKYAEFIPDLFISIADGVSLRFLTSGSTFDVSSFIESIHGLFRLLLK